jgi:hypothetical protein
MKRIIRRTVTVVTTETWSIVEDEDASPPDPEIGSHQTGLLLPAPEDPITSQSDAHDVDAETEIPAKTKGSRRTIGNKGR